MARVGKIARLPQELREELNRRMADGEVGGSLLRWLNALPATREVLEGGFGGAAITKQNLSEWRKGGFREWHTRQELFADAGKVSARARALREVSGDKLTDDLATVLAGEYAVVLKRWLAQPTQDLEARLRVLHRLCRDIVALRRGDHCVARLKLNLERWEFESNLVQAKNLHRGDAETRRECEVGDDVRERAGVLGDGGRGESNLVQTKIFHHGGTETQRECGVADDARERAGVPSDGGRGESNLVQVKNFRDGGTETPKRFGGVDELVGWVSEAGVSGDGRAAARDHGGLHASALARAKLMPTELAIAG